jgi:cytochrome c-type biogenesis protein CcmH
MMKRAFLLFILGCLLSTTGWAVVEVYEFDESAQEEQYKHLISVMRCPKCLNSNLAGSDAGIAADLKAEIYDQIMVGQSDAEIMAFMTERYGDFINYRPPLNRGTLFLWFGPGLLLIAGFIIALRMMKNSQAGSVDGSLNDEEKQKLQDILSSHSDS